MAFPWKHEQKSSVTSIVIQQSHLVGAIIARKNNVCTGSPSHRCRHLVSGFFRVHFHLSHPIGKRSACEDNTVGTDFESLPGHPIYGVHTNHLSGGRILDGIRHFDVIRDGGSFFGRAHCNGQVRPRVVVLCFVKDGTIFQIFLFELRENLSRLFLCHDKTRGTLKKRERVVYFQDRRGQNREKTEKRVFEGRGRNVPLGEGHCNRNPVAQMALLVHHKLTLLVAVKHHLHLAIESFDRLHGTGYQICRQQSRRSRRHVFDPCPD
mmetsp:Transcript_9498/g.19938  ORF Transcript_9498/g.19938 Transcript_9498/m.19938 type:complete len:265 (-) Transcript_9498:743-1537(-)